MKTINELTKIAEEEDSNLYAVMFNELYDNGTDYTREWLDAILLVTNENPELLDNFESILEDKINEINNLN